MRRALPVAFLLICAGCTSPNYFPIADFSFTPSTAFAPASISFDGGASYDPDGAVIDWRWTFGDGASGSGRGIQHTFNSEGTYFVTLTVRDERGAVGSCTKSITIRRSYVPPYTPPPAPEIPTPPAPSMGMWDFIEHCQDAWEYETDDFLETVQSPATSYVTMRGDCDDFATMMAYFLEEAYNRDSIILLLKATDGGSGHAVAAFRASVSEMTDYYASCPSHAYPYVTSSATGETYLPADFHRCIGWDWDDYGIHETREWESMVGEIMSVTPR